MEQDHLTWIIRLQSGYSAVTLRILYSLTNLFLSELYHLMSLCIYSHWLVYVDYFRKGYTLWIDRSNQNASKFQTGRKEIKLLSYQERRNCSGSSFPYLSCQSHSYTCINFGHFGLGRLGMTRQVRIPDGWTEVISETQELLIYQL